MCKGLAKLPHCLVKRLNDPSTLCSKRVVREQKSNNYVFHASLLCTVLACVNVSFVVYHHCIQPIFCFPCSVSCLYAFKIKEWQPNHTTFTSCLLRRIHQRYNMCTFLCPSKDYLLAIAIVSLCRVRSWVLN